MLTAPNLVPPGGPTFGQIARYGDKIFVGTASGHLYTWQLISGTWTLVSGYDLHMDHPYYEWLHCLPLGPCPLPTGSFTKYVLGLAVKGDGVNAKGAWVTTVGTTRYYDLYYYGGTATNLSDPNNWNSRLSVYTKAVVTALGGVGKFFVENQERTTGAWVSYMTAADPSDVGKFVTIKALAAKTASGEKYLDCGDTVPFWIADRIVFGDIADPAIKPLYITNKTMGLATGGAGLANDGMLVTVCGKVTGAEQSLGMYFFVDDGSGVPSGVADPTIGVKVCKADGTDMSGVANILRIVTDGEPGWVPLPSYAVITGVVRLEGGDEILPATNPKTYNPITRRIDARSIADIVITAL